MGRTIKIASVKDVPPDSMRTFEVQGMKILLANVGGEFYAMGGLCTHEGWDLSWGALAPRKLQVVCGGHGAVFDLKTGKGIRLGRWVPPEKIYKVTIKGSEVFVDIE